MARAIACLRRVTWVGIELLKRVLATFFSVTVKYPTEEG